MTSGGAICLALGAFNLAIVALCLNEPAQLHFVSATSSLPGPHRGHPGCAQMRQPTVTTPESLQAVPLCLLGAVTICIATASRKRRKVVRGGVILRAKVQKGSPSEITAALSKGHEQLVGRMEETKKDAESAVKTTLTSAAEFLDSCSKMPARVKEQVEAHNCLVLKGVRSGMDTMEHFETSAKTVQNTVNVVANFPRAAKERLDESITRAQNAITAIVNYPTAAQVALEERRDSLVTTVRNTVDAAVSFQSRAKKQINWTIDGAKNIVTSLVQFWESVATVHGFLVGAVQFHLAHTSADDKDSMSAYEKYLLPALRDMERQTEKSAAERQR